MRVEVMRSVAAAQVGSKGPSPGASSREQKAGAGAELCPQIPPRDRRTRGQPPAPLPPGARPFYLQISLGGDEK